MNTIVTGDFEFLLTLPNIISNVDYHYSPLSFTQFLQFSWDCLDYFTVYKINFLSIKMPCVLQENDYMSLLFHLYDSDNEDDGEGDGNEDRPDTLQMALIRYRLTRKFMN